MGSKKLDILRDSPLYTQTEAALYLGIPRPTLRYWAIGETTDSRRVTPLIKLPKSSNQLSFLNLVELHVLSAIRRQHNVVLPKVRKSINYVRKQLGVERPLLEQTFETDGVDLFVEHYGDLLNVSEEGQQAMRLLLEGSLKRIERDSKHIPVKLFPYTHSRVEDSPRYVSMTPSLFSGRPVIEGTGISTAVVAERYKAGDSVKMLANDYDVTPSRIEEAIRCELQKAA